MMPLAKFRNPRWRQLEGAQAALESYRGKLKPLEFDPTPF
jgi:hypothetical protein